MDPGSNVFVSNTVCSTERKMELGGGFYNDHREYRIYDCASGHSALHISAQLSYAH